MSTGYAGTLTPLDYPMNRNVIYGSFSGMEGWCESHVDRAIAYNTSRHFTPQAPILFEESHPNICASALYTVYACFFFYQSTVDTANFTDQVENYRVVLFTRDRSIIVLCLSRLYVASRCGLYRSSRNYEFTSAE